MSRAGAENAYAYRIINSAPRDQVVEVDHAYFTVSYPAAAIDTDPVYVRNDITLMYESRGRGIPQYTRYQYPSIQSADSEIARKGFVSHRLPVDSEIWNGIRLTIRCRVKELSD
jgi:hypothetical protein